MYSTEVGEHALVNSTIDALITAVYRALGENKIVTIKNTY